MRIIIDIGHPGHVHLFRPFAQTMIAKGHEILFTCRQKEFEIELLKAAKFNYKSFGKHYKSLIGKIWGLFYFDFLMLLSTFRFKPDIFLSHGSFYAAHIAFLFRKPHISMEDTGNQEQMRLYLPFTQVVLTSSAFHKEIGPKQIRYNSYHEIAYLHPKYFSKDELIDEKLGIPNGESFVLLRFVSWNASHDINKKGLSLLFKTKLVEELSKYSKIYISSEGNLPRHLERYRLIIKPEQLHHILSSATLYIGEGATMASESAVLGVPAIYINPINAGTIDEQERYGLLFHFKSEVGVFEKALELLNNQELSAEIKVKQKEMLNRKIDLTAFLVWFVEEYPVSKKIMRETPNYQYQFK